MGDEAKFYAEEVNNVNIVLFVTLSNACSTRFENTKTVQMCHTATAWSKTRIDSSFQINNKIKEKTWCLSIQTGLNLIQF